LLDAGETNSASAGGMDESSFHDEADEDSDDPIKFIEWFNLVPIIIRFIDTVKNMIYFVRAFKFIDADGSGNLTRLEFVEAIAANEMLAQVLGLPQLLKVSDGSKERFESLFREIDSNGSGSISKAEFVSFFAAHLQRV